MHSTDKPTVPHDLVRLDADHPGFRDPDYRARRNEIARLAASHHTRQPIPRITYTARENALWRHILGRLLPLQDEKASRFIVELRDRLAFSQTTIPQLVDLNPLLRRASGFEMIPVAGLVTPRAFLESLARSAFPSTQCIRHASRPFYTPEPDVVHELVGHAATLTNSEIADVSRRFGLAASRAKTDDEVERIVRMYWYTLEFGVVMEDGNPKAFGAGLLSSVDELTLFDRAGRLQAFDVDDIAATPYDPTQLQPRLFVAQSVEALLGALDAWLPKR